MENTQNTKNYLLKPFRAINLNSLKNDDKRIKDRLSTKGFVIIHDLKTKKHYKTKIINFSIGGMCCEIAQEGLSILTSEVIIEFAGPIARAGLDVVKSKVMWASPIDGHPEKKLLIGLEFTNEMTATKLKKIAEFAETLRNQ